MRTPYPNELRHYGIKGQKRGIRRFQYEDGSLTPAGRDRYGIGQYTDTGTGNRGKVPVNRPSGSRQISITGSARVYQRKQPSAINNKKVSKTQEGYSRQYYSQLSEPTKQNAASRYERQQTRTSKSLIPKIRNLFTLTSLKIRTVSRRVRDTAKKIRFDTKKWLVTKRAALRWSMSNFKTRHTRSESNKETFKWIKSNKK